MSYSLPFKQGQRLIELGGGKTPRIRPNLDKIPGPTVDVVADLNEKLPLPDRGYDGVFLSYIAEHVSWRRVRDLLAEVYRILDFGGTAVLIVPNTLEQCKLIVERGDWTDEEAQMLFGDQNYEGKDWDGNAHHAGFSPTFVFNVLREAGFTKIIVIRHPDEKARDMIVEATKEKGAEHKHEDIGADKWTPAERAAAYDQAYFNGGGKVGGYSKEGFWDYPVHELTAQKILELKPESVLEIGAARGYILKRLEDQGVRVAGLEVSTHCFHTRVVDDIRTWDVTQTPWPFKDKEFDVCISIATMEHIPESVIPAIASEMARVSKRGLHGIDLGQHDDGFDKTHCTLKSLDWWRERLPAEQQVCDKEDLERGDIPIPPGDGKIKLNIGSYTVMFHHGWINIDLADVTSFANRYGYRFARMDVRRGLPYDDGIVDLIYTSHFLEHLTYDEGAAFLKECRRVMRPGGLIRIIVPGARHLTNIYSRVPSGLKQFDELSPTAAKSPHETRKLWELLMANHLAIYDGDLLCAMLKEAGFTSAIETSFRQSLSKQMLIESRDMFPTISLFVEGVA